METIDLKCRGEHCPIKNTCLRYKAPASDNQTYFLFSPIRGEKCAHHVPVEQPKTEPEAAPEVKVPVKQKRTRK